MTDIEGAVPALRAVRPDDAEALAWISSQPAVRRGTLRLPFESPESWLKRLACFEADGVRLIVAEIDGTVIGYAGLHPNRSPRLAHSASLGITVADAFTGRGVGSALLAALIDLADNWYGLRRLELDVFCDNLAAIRLYERFGFVREGVKVKAGLCDGVYKDIVMMARLKF